MGMPPGGPMMGMGMGMPPMGPGAGVGMGACTPCMSRMHVGMVDVHTRTQLDTPSINGFTTGSFAPGALPSPGMGMGPRGMPPMAFAGGPGPLPPPGASRR